MKIIGNIGRDAFIVTATEDELAKIAGYTYASAMPNGHKPEAGKEIPVSDLYKALCSSRERKAEIADLANKLRSAAGRVDSINQALATPIVEVKAQQ